MGSAGKITTCLVMVTETAFFSFEPLFIRIGLPSSRERLCNGLRGVNRNSGDGLAIESAEVGFIAGEKGMAAMLDG